LNSPYIYICIIHEHNVIQLRRLIKHIHPLSVYFSPEVAYLYRPRHYPTQPPWTYYPSPRRRLQSL